MIPPPKKKKSDKEPTSPTAKQNWKIFHIDPSSVLSIQFTSMASYREKDKRTSSKLSI